MGCNCKQKKRRTLPQGEGYTFNELKDAFSIMTKTINYSYEDQDFLYDLHNRIFIDNKQLNRSCSECFKKVRINLTNRYEYEKRTKTK